MEEALTEYELLKQTIRKGEFTPAEQNEWETLKKSYPNGMPAKDELLKLNRICEDVRHKEDQLANAQTTARALKQVAAQKKPEQASPLPLVLGCLALVLGVGLSFVQVLAGVAAFVVLALAAVVLL